MNQFIKKYFIILKYYFFLGLYFAISNRISSKLMIVLYNVEMKNKLIYIVNIWMLALFSVSSLNAGGKVLSLTGTSFAKTIKVGKPVLVKFYLPTCPACEMMTPEFAAASTNVGSRALFGSLDASKYPEIARKYGVHSVPTTIMFFRGKEKDRLSIFVGREQLEQWVSDFAR